MALSQVFLEYARGLGDSGPTVAALNNLSRLLAEQGRREEARTASERALELGQEQGDRHRVAALYTTWPTSFWRADTTIQLWNISRSRPDSSLVWTPRGRFDRRSGRSSSGDRLRVGRDYS